MGILKDHFEIGMFSENKTHILLGKFSMSGVSFVSRFQSMATYNFPNFN